MPTLNAHPERHLVERIGWLRAAVLGANDGIVSTASLIVGVAAAATTRGEVLLAGVAGLVAGAMSMAAGEYVSVSSQADTEAADLSRERKELAASPALETQELSSIYQARGLDKATADAVAAQFMAKDAIGAHARDELSITHVSTARPVQAAMTSAATFTSGASLPLLAAWLSPAGRPMIVGVSVASLLFLAILGGRGESGRCTGGQGNFARRILGRAGAAIGKLVGTAV